LNENRFESILVLLFQALPVSRYCTRGHSFRRSKLSENLHSWCAWRVATRDALSWKPNCSQQNNTNLRKLFLAGSPRNAIPIYESI